MCVFSLQKKGGGVDSNSSPHCSAPCGSIPLIARPIRRRGWSLTLRTGTFPFRVTWLQVVQTLGALVSSFVLHPLCSATQVC